MTKKFRIWSPYHKKFVVQGGEFGLQRLFEDFSITLKGRWQRNEDYKMPSHVGGYIIQQWTGLTDSQGVEIYEGDILEYINDSAFGNIFYDRMTVEWEIEGDGFGGLNCGFRMGGDYATKKSAKVIGNIFQNS